jgi:catechol 2,3-dioxygenase-like lactoylglutathione lyase family enzyme
MAGTQTIRTIGILHFTIPVRDHRKAADYYRDLLGCEVVRISDIFAFMRCGGTYFVLATMPEAHVNANPPRGTKNHHAFMVAPEEFDRAREIIEGRGIEIVRYEDTGHVVFPGRHLYFHDPDDNCLEVIDLRVDAR